MVNVVVAATSGVPVIIAELDELFASVKPCGRLPELIDQENGETPPVACKVCVYANVTIQLGKAAVVMDRAGGGNRVPPPQPHTKMASISIKQIRRRVRDMIPHPFDY
jgi:hypothetical protein